MQRMSHILHGERAWFQRIAGREPDREIWNTLNVTELREILDHHERTYSALLQGDLQRVVAYTRFTGERYASPIADILAHLVTHGAHHRGQLAARVAGTGLEPVNTDFIQFCLATGL